ncbi:MAG: MBL fold metallo-hydrolase [Bacteroidetes bacterium]|nr:MBL fold metallo-hydrolase [Bacteroidota bacterium]
MIFPLSEGSFTIGHDKVFVPFDAEKEQLSDRPTGSLLVEVQPFLIQLPGDLLLLDSGLGFSDAQGRMQLHQNIRKQGFEPEQVTKVLISHLHKDHSGGLLQSGGGALRPALPLARYYIYRAEAAFALATGYPSYHPEDFEPLLQSGQVEWLDAEQGAITESIRYQHSGGHSPQHIVFHIQSGNEKIFYGGDEAPQLRQLRFKYVAKYDFDGRKAMQLREHWAEQGRAEHWKFLFYHDIKCPVAELAPA